MQQTRATNRLSKVMSPARLGLMGVFILVMLVVLENLPAIKHPSRSDVTTQREECKALCAAVPEPCTEIRKARKRTQQSYVACRQRNVPPQVSRPQSDPQQIGASMEAYAKSLPQACVPLLKQVPVVSEKLQNCHTAGSQNCHEHQVTLDGHWFALHGCVQSWCQDQGFTLKDKVCAPYKKRVLTNCGRLFTEIHPAQLALHECLQKQRQHGKSCRNHQEQSRAAGLAYAQCKLENCLLYPEELSRLICAPVPSLSSPADCHAEQLAQNESEMALRSCLRESREAAPDPCWKEVRACENKLNSDYRATLASVKQMQSILDGLTSLLYWLLALVGILWSRTKDTNENRSFAVIRMGVLVLSLLLLSWLCFGLLLDLLFPKGMIAH